MDILDLKVEIIMMIEKFCDDENIKNIFSGHINVQDFINQIIFELYKNMVIEQSEKRSLRSYISSFNKDNYEAEYEAKKRILRYANKYKEKLRKRLSERGDDVSKISSLKIKRFDTVRDRVKGYRLDKFNNFQLETMQKCNILNNIINNRITSNRKIKNDEFIAMYKELDEYILRLRNVDSDSDYVMSIINIYDIERHYLTELIYCIATYIQDNNIKYLSDNIYLGILSHFTLEESFKCENRFILKRQLYIRDVINYESDISTLELNRLVNILYLKFNILKSKNLRKLIAQIDVSKIEKYIRKNYDLFSIIKEKEWNNKKIRLARVLFNDFFLKDEKS